MMKLLCLATVALTCTLTLAAEPRLPDPWQADWQNPPASCRPMQIVHGIPKERASVAGMKYYQDLGLGGLVTNVNFHEYLKSEPQWKVLVDGVEACRQLGLRVWLYDEHGYPSGTAGGQVLAENRAFEALSLAYDPSKADPFVLRPGFEFTHASNNYHDVRRYINLLDADATACFIRKTHAAYWQRLEPHFGKTIEAAFTDEPSLMNITMGKLPEKFRSKTHVTDPIDPNLVALPSVPWSRDIQAEYVRRYGHDLTPLRKSLFTGDEPADKKVRSQFWAMVADLVADRYYGQLRRWCGAHRIASSGHKLCEESLLLHVPLDGNGLAVLRQMQIPGMDMLSSNPAAVNGMGWMTAAMPASAAAHQGVRQVMTEISDFSERIGPGISASLANMQAAAAWQAAWGVTEFTLYYQPKDRSADDYRAYCAFVGRLNAVLKPAQPAADVLLYYPICDLWAEYKPTADRVTLESQSPKTRTLVTSFNNLGRALQKGQVPFVLVDHQPLAEAKVDGGKLIIAGRAYTTLIVPELAELPAQAQAVVSRFQAGGGKVLNDSPEARRPAGGLLAKVERAYRAEPASGELTFGKYRRDGRTVLIVANVGEKRYDGSLRVPGDGAWLRLDPASGAVANVAVSGGRLPLALERCQTVLLVSP